MDIIKPSALEAWKEALQYILKHGHRFVDREQRVCIEALNVSLTIEQPLPDVDEPMRIMQQSDQWIYPTKEELASIMLDKHSQGIYEYTYGPRIFHFQQAKDQIQEFIIPLLQQDPTSRRAAVILYDPIKDSVIENKNIPSLLLIYFKVRSNHLHVTCFIRSNDFFVGWPANVFQVFVLQQLVAEKLGLSIGSLTTFSASAHIFEEHTEWIERILKN